VLPAIPRKPHCVTKYEIGGCVELLDTILQRFFCNTVVLFMLDPFKNKKTCFYVYSHVHWLGTMGTQTMLAIRKHAQPPI